MRASTIIASNYLAFASVLADTFLRHHPQSTFTLLIIDDACGLELPAGVDVLHLDELGFNPTELDRMKAIYTVMELATAVKPALLRTLLRSDSVVCFLDPDIQVFASFDDIVDRVEEIDIVLTPHVLTPLPRDGLAVSERSIMQAGIFNLGFIAVGHGAAAFLDWWHERLLVDAISDVSVGLFTDQRWIDWVPSLFRHEVCRDAGMNVAYWNMHERHLNIEVNSEISVNGTPLRFFHFSGYDADAPTQLSRHDGVTARVSLDDRPVVRRLADAYGQMIVDRDHHRLRHRPYQWDRSSTGLPLAGYLRRVYRDELLEHVSRGRSMSDGLGGPPSPFEPAHAEQFEAWACEPVHGTLASPISRCEGALWNHRADLARAFPDIDGNDAGHFRGWLDTDPSGLEALSPFSPPIGRPAGPDRHGWNVVGYFRAELGVGEAARLLAGSLELAGFHVARVALDAPGSRAGHRQYAKTSSLLQYRNTLCSVNADQTAAALSRYRITESTGGKRIGLWFWEVNRFPAKMASSFKLLDEVWTASRYTQMTLQAYTDSPIRIFPLPVDIPTAPTRHTWSTLSLPVHGEVFVCVHDFHSVARRKNAAGAIAAYCEATAKSDGTTLLVKSINGDQHGGDLAALRAVARSRPDVVIIDGYVSSGALRAIVQLASGLVSLHRAEGFGLNLAHAMLLGTPVVATAFSGNMDFMDDDSGYLVPYELTEVGVGADPYPSDATWAEPDLSAAAKAIRRILDNPVEARAVADRARHQARDRFDPARTTAFLLEHASFGLAPGEQASVRHAQMDMA